MRIQNMLDWATGCSRLFCVKKMVTVCDYALDYDIFQQCHPITFFHTDGL